MITRAVKLLFIFLFFHSTKIFAQPDTIAIAAADVVFERVEVEASFPGGFEAWAKFLQKNLNAETPVKKGAKAGTYTVVVQFVVDREGNVSDLRALTHHGFGMEEEVLRVLVKSPKWLPARQSGRFVKAYRKQPITFLVTEE